MFEKYPSANVSVMPGLVPGIHVLETDAEDVDGRNESGHDESVEPAHDL
jgi:hypothetical protein